MSNNKSIFERLQYVSATILLLSFPAVYMHYDWWIYGLLPMVSGVLSIYPKPDCGLWRFFTSVTIVLGVLECVFLNWTFRSLKDVPVQNGGGIYGIFHEGHFITFATFATIVIICVRMVNDEYEFTLAKLIRTLLLLSMFIACSFVALDSFRHNLLSIYGA